MATHFSLTITPAPSDIDELGHVNNAVWVRWIQDVARVHWSVVAPLRDQEVWVWVVVRHEIDYLGNVGVAEQVTARTWISDPPKGARFDRNVDFTNAKGTLIVSAKTTWALVNKASGRISRVPHTMAALFLN